MLHGGLAVASRWRAAEMSHAPDMGFGQHTDRCSVRIFVILFKPSEIILGQHAQIRPRLNLSESLKSPHTQIIIFFVANILQKLFITSVQGTFWID